MTTAAAAAATLYDALIIGAGPGGLSVATGLARQLHTAVVFSTNVFRNARAKHMHNVVGWDHRDPADFRAAARKDLLARYSTIQFHDVGVKDVSRRPDGRFEARDMNGQIWQGKKLVLAAGVRDVSPDIEGYADCWSESIFHCLFCDGYEEHGAQSAGVLATDLLQSTQRVMHVSQMAKRLAKSVTLYTNRDSDHASTLKNLFANKGGFKFDSRAISKLEKGSRGASITIHFKDGSHAEEAFLVHNPKYVLNGCFDQQLKLELTEMGDLKVSPVFNETSMPGVFAVGDCAIAMKSVTQAVAMGTGTAGAITMQLHEED